jgi:hypothetical protein
MEERLGVGVALALIGVAQLFLASGPAASGTPSAEAATSSSCRVGRPPTWNPRRFPASAHVKFFSPVLVLACGSSAPCPARLRGGPVDRHLADDADLGRPQDLWHGSRLLPSVDEESKRGSRASP